MGTDSSDSKGKAMKFVDIIYVDDNKLNRFIVEKQLSVHFSVMILTSGQELFEALNQFTPRVIILDWMMPEISGFEILQKLRSQAKFKSLIILMLTARASKNDMVRSLSAGANDYLVKPPHYPELIARIKALLRQRRAEEQIRMKNQIRSYEVLLKGLTHEFNNIFSAVNLSLQMYERKGPEYFDRKLPDLKELMSRGAELVRDLRKFRNRSDDEKTMLDVRALLLESVHDFEKSMEFTDFPIDLSMISEQSLFIFGIRDQLIQVFVNLLDNARKAICAKDDGKIEISLRGSEDLIQICISDNGTGLKPEIIDNLHTLFFTEEESLGSHPSRMLGTPSSGLSTCKRILAGHNANIDIQCPPQGGTRVLIEFLDTDQLES